MMDGVEIMIPRTETGDEALIMTLETASIDTYFSKGTRREKGREEKGSTRKAAERKGRRGCRLTFLPRGLLALQPSLWEPPDHSDRDEDVRPEKYCWLDGDAVEPDCG
jgi:hypothetical protein